MGQRDSAIKSLSFTVTCAGGGALGTHRCTAPLRFAMGTAQVQLNCAVLQVQLNRRGTAVILSSGGTARAPRVPLHLECRGLATWDRFTASQKVQLSGGGYKGYPSVVRCACR